MPSKTRQFQALEGADGPLTTFQLSMSPPVIPGHLKVLESKTRQFSGKEGAVT